MKTVYNISRDLAIEGISEWIKACSSVELEIILEEVILNNHVVCNIHPDNYSDKGITITSLPSLSKILTGQ